MICGFVVFLFLPCFHGSLGDSLETDFARNEDRREDERVNEPSPHDGNCKSDMISSFQSVTEPTEAGSGSSPLSRAHMSHLQPRERPRGCLSKRSNIRIHSWPESHRSDSNWNELSVDLLLDFDGLLLPSSLGSWLTMNDGSFSSASAV